MQEPGITQWKVIKDYGQAVNGNEEYIINPNINYSKGTYRISVWIKRDGTEGKITNAEGLGKYDNYATVSFNVYEPLKISSLNVQKPILNTSDMQGYYISSSDDSLVQYKVLINYIGTDKWEVIQEYSEPIKGNIVHYITPSFKYKAGEYRVSVWTKRYGTEGKITNQQGLGKYDDYKTINFKCVDGQKNYKLSYYNITLDEMVNKQMSDTPAYHMYLPEKDIYEWRYAIVKNGKKGYSTDINGVNWVQSDQQYEYIKSKAREYIDPTNQIYDSIGQYQFLQLSYNECTTAQQLNNVLKGKGVLEGKGQVFIDAGKENNVSPIYLVAHALLETGNGTSILAKGVVVNGRTVHNLFGINAVDSDPVGQGSKYAYEQGWFSIDLAIKGGAKWISGRYINNAIYKQDTLYKMRWNPSNPAVHQYATDIRWAYNQVNNIKGLIDKLSNVILNFDVPVFK
ncbi:beta-N-acetylglucosaminidase [Clostridium sporogenes]